MISKKIFLPETPTHRFLSDFIIRNEQYARPYVYIFDPQLPSDGSGDKLQDGTTDQANHSFPNNLWVSGVSHPSSRDIISQDYWSIIDSSINFYDPVPAGSTLWLEVATTSEEFGETLTQPSVEAAEKWAVMSEKWAEGTEPRGPTTKSSKEWAAEAKFYADMHDPSKIVHQSDPTGAAEIPKGTTVQRPKAPINGNLRYNEDRKVFEGYKDGVWGAIDGEIFIVDSVLDLPSLDPAQTKFAIVKDSYRGGEFIYDSSKSGENDKGTIFNGWVRQYNGVLNILWFGARPDGTDTGSSVDDANIVRISKGEDLVVPKGTYLRNGVTYVIDGLSVLRTSNYTGGINILESLQSSSLSINVETPDTPGVTQSDARVGVAITNVVKGGNHGDCIRTNLINYSDDGNGNTGVYSRALSTGGIGWSAAIHGETRHDNGTTSAISAEASGYSTTGSMFGVLVNNTTRNDTHPITGAAMNKPAICDALHIIGGVSGDASKWNTGLFIGASSIAPLTGYGIRMVADGKYSLFLEGNAEYGAVFNGAYSKGSAIRLQGGVGIAFEGTGAKKIKYDNTSLRLGVFSGSTELGAFGATSTNAGVYVQGVKVVGAQRPAISDSTAVDQNATKINEILAALRAHGLIA